MRSDHPPPRRPVARPLPYPVAAPGYYPYPQQAQRRYRRGPHPVIAFIQGYLFGLAGSAVFLTSVLAAAVLLFPPSRMNVLIVGLDRRPDESHYVTRSDTLILTTVYPRGVYAGMLSIPRDLWVTLPNGGVGRVNTAHFFAEASRPGSGPESTVNTVRSNFGVDVHRFVRLDLMGFVRVVDAMGGIEMDVPRPLIDYEYPTYDYGTTYVAFAAGPQRMDGERALAYARIRHGSSDFQRAERQQMVSEAIFRRILNPLAWPRLPLVAAAYFSSVDTDLTVVDMALLAPTLLRVGPAGLDRRVIQGGMLQPFTTDGGASVQLPVWEVINPVLMEMFGQ
jgi:polyisoprenyl-teichoic acid--peptidoglycan teichoic acid transferase